MSVLEIVAVIAIIGYVIGRQLLGEHLRGKRLIVLPVALVAIGASGLIGHGHHLGNADISLILIGGVVAAGIGIAQGSLMRLEARDGTLWGQMPVRSLWLWLALVTSRVVLDVVASGVGAHVAASTAPILLTLGINRLAQACVVAPRALAAGIPFTPEKNGSTFLPDVLGADVFGANQAQTPPTSSSTLSSPSGDRTGGSEWQSGLRMIADRISARVEQR
jgi:hypothetical protein